jgi:hypothetical protein
VKLELQRDLVPECAAAVLERSLAAVEIRKAEESLFVVLESQRQRMASSWALVGQVLVVEQVIELV